MRTDRKWVNDSIRRALVIVAVVVFATVCISAVQAQQPQTGSSEVKELKDRVKQLEQTVDELKAALLAIQAARNNNTQAATGEQAANVVTPTAPTTGAAAAPPKPDEPKGESTFTIYGFAMLNSGYEFQASDPKWFDTVRPVKLPAFRGQFEPGGNTYFSVRQSRFGVKSSTPTKYGELKTIFEFELFGTGVDAGQTTFRLRHAYGELGHFGAGQYWSAFVDPDVFPNTNEYWGPNGIAWFRNVQFRWMPIKGRNSVTIALERPGASADLGQAADRIELAGVKPRFPLPDLTGNVRFERGWGHVQIGGVLRDMRWVDTVDDNFDLGGRATGAGFGITSALNAGKKDVVKLSYVSGHGIENYMNDAPVDVGIVPSNSGNPRVPIKGEALPVWGWMAYLDHTWNKRFTSSIGYSMLNIANSSGQTNDAFHRGHYGSGNFMFLPADRVTLGTEVIYGRRENFRDGFTADDVHLQFIFKYNFNKELKF
jgi:outer membrane murein-binding lipoprotein Lpp